MGEFVLVISILVGMDRAELVSILPSHESCTIVADQILASAEHRKSLQIDSLSCIALDTYVDNYGPVKETQLKDLKNLLKKSK